MKTALLFVLLISAIIGVTVVKTATIERNFHTCLQAGDMTDTDCEICAQQRRQEINEFLFLNK